MQKISRPGPLTSAIRIHQVWGMSWWKMPIFIIYVVFQTRDVSDLWILSRWQLATLINCVGFWRRDVLDLWILFSEVDCVIVKILSSATPLIPAVVSICQGRGMSWRKWVNLVRCVNFRKLDGSDLEGLVSAETKIFWEVTLERERSETGTAWGFIWSL